MMQQPSFCSWMSWEGGGGNGDYFGAARNLSKFQKLDAISNL